MSTFSVAAFAEAWEYDNDDKDSVIEDEYTDLVGHRRHASTSSRTAPGRGGRVKTVGVFERKANTTYIGGEVAIGKEAKGDTKFLMMVTFTYRGDTVDGMDIGDKGGDVGWPLIRTTNPPSFRLVNVNNPPEIKIFSYNVVIDLGKFLQRWGGVCGRETLRTRVGLE